MVECDLVFKSTICKRKTLIKKIKTRERGYLKSMSSKFHPRNLNFLLLSHSYSYFKILIFVCLNSVVSYIDTHTYLCYILFSLPTIACFGWRPHQKFSNIVNPKKRMSQISNSPWMTPGIIIYIHALSYLGCFYWSTEANNEAHLTSALLLLPLVTIFL